MKQSRGGNGDAQEALRDALEQMLVSVKAASALAADRPATTTSNEREALEEKRQRLLRLLAELPPPSFSSGVSPHLLFPCDADEQGRQEQATEQPCSASETPVPPPPPPQRLLGNVFASPVLYFDAVGRDAAHHRHRRGETTRRKAKQSFPSSSPSWVNLREDTVDASRGREDSWAHASHRSGDAAEHRNMSALVSYPLRRASSLSTALVAVSSSPLSPRCGPPLYDYTCLPPTFWINVWPCFGSAVARTAKPTRVLVRGCYRYFADVVERAAAQTGCQPACHALYTPEGLPVCELQDLAVEGHYLLFPSGGFYRTQAVPTALLWLLYKDARRVVQCS